jgi:hypothetical protein
MQYQFAKTRIKHSFTSGRQDVVLLLLIDTFTFHAPSLELWVVSVTCKLEAVLVAYSP